MQHWFNEFIVCYVKTSYENGRVGSHRNNRLNVVHGRLADVIWNGNPKFFVSKLKFIESIHTT